MSIYDKAINSLLAGETIRLSEQTNVVSLRRHYNRMCANLRKDGIAIAKVLHIQTTNDGDYRLQLTDKHTLPFVVEKPNEDT